MRILMGKIYDMVYHKYLAGVTFERLRCRIAVVTIMVLMLSLIPLSISANPGLTVTNAAIIDTVLPGTVLTQTMTVSIGNADPATDISVSIDGVAQSPTGGYELLDADQDTGPYSAREFVTVDKSSFHLEPGGSQDVIATVRVPQDVGTGGRFAIINFVTQPQAGAGGVGIISAVDVPVYLTIAGSQLTQTGKITGVSAGEITNGQPVHITTTFQNTGNIYYKVQGEVIVATDQGFTLDAIPIPLTNASIIPGISRELDAIYTPGGSLPPGTYTISSKIMMQDGNTVLDQSTGTFTIKAPYVPPPALGNVSLAPSGASTLKSTDGTISIYFPQGAAAVPVNISLNNITASQLPVAPIGFTLTGNALDAAGLTGLLAKNATVTVKYTSDDLSKANGKASSLVLVRWDPGTNQWVVLKTKVNSTAMTLSASSNQMGIWAVAVGKVTSSGTNWKIIGVIIAVVIIVVGILAIFLITRRKQKGNPIKSK